MDVPRYEDGGDRLVGPDGVSWAVVADWLEPGEIEALSARRVPLAIEWCESWEWPARMRPEVREMIVSVERSNSLSRGEYPDAVMMMPTLWTQYAGGPLLVVLSESAPLRREVLEEYSRMPAGLLADLGPGQSTG